MRVQTQFPTHRGLGWVRSITEGLGNDIEWDDIAFTMVDVYDLITEELFRYTRIITSLPVSCQPARGLSRSQSVVMLAALQAETRVELQPVRPDQVNTDMLTDLAEGGC